MVEFHCRDFDWDAHADQVRPEVADGLAAAAAQDPREEAALIGEAGARWEDFHRRQRGNFYKPRRFLVREFPLLLGLRRGAVLLEVGCGYGCSLLPILEGCEGLLGIGLDVSETAIRLFREHRSFDPARMSAGVWDMSSGAPLPPGLPAADALLFVFSLSALPPRGQEAALAASLAALAPGGYVLLRDHGVFDYKHVRALRRSKEGSGRGAALGENLYRRPEGTLAYYFSLDAVRKLASGAQLEVVECEYHCVYNRNRKTGAEMKRVFVHAVLRKPLGGRGRGMT